MKIKVLFITHQMSGTLSGGVETQMKNTACAINKLNTDFEINFFNGWDNKLDDYDIVHIFTPCGFPSESLNICSYSKSKGLKVVTTPIFFINSQESSKTIYTQIYQGYRKLFNMKPFNILDPLNFVKQTLYQSDLVLPNTLEEKEIIYKYFNINKQKMRVIPNGVNLSFADGDSNLFSSEYDVRNYMLFVGRIEPRKNLLMLIKAFNSMISNNKLIIIGKPVDIQYYESCKREAHENILFLPPLDNGSQMLKSAYSGADVFVLPSLYETPGLAALEAGLAGAKIVITGIGGTKEYFGDYAEYVNPMSMDSIKNALLNSAQKAKNKYLSNHIKEHYSWKRVGEQTIEAYKTVFK